jgi:hypothetical protein
MSERRRKFSQQFKAEAVQLVVETGKPIAEVARLAPRRPHAHLAGRRCCANGHRRRPRGRGGDFHSDKAPNTPRPSSTGSAGTISSEPASDAPACAGTTPSPSTSRFSTTAAGCTAPSATAPRTKHSPSSAPRQPLHDQQPEELSKIVHTAQRAPRESWPAANSRPAELQFQGGTTGSRRYQPLSRGAAAQPRRTARGQPRADRGARPGAQGLGHRLARRA